MGQALYRKYRSKSLDEVVGQEHITATLKNALQSDHISHAYLFTGPRGVGKTSIARIWAHEINNLPYDESTNHLDIIEIDAASNRRIDEIRELRDKVQISPSSAKYKVYIIDEVHMLTKEAFNALLKTLEEPPAHAVFILATTEAHKLPDTIVSRTQRFTFKPIEVEDVVKHLRSIAKSEKINVNDDALNLMARHGDGSFRDSISLLDQASSLGTDIQSRDIEQLLGIVPETGIEKLVDALTDLDSKTINDLLEELTNAGSTPTQIAKQTNNKLRDLLVSEASLPGPLIRLMRALLEVPASHDPSMSLQLALFSAVTQSTESTPRKPKETMAVNIPEAKITQPEPKLESVKPKIPDPEPEQVIESIESNEVWPKVLVEIKKHHNTLYSIARMAKTSTGENTINLEFSFAFHQKRINESKNKQIIADTLKKITGRDYEITTSSSTAQDEIKEPIQAPKKTNNKALDNISNIFGSAEVLES